MTAGHILLIGTIALAAQSASPPAPQPSACVRALSGGPDAAGGEICAGEEADRLANAAPNGSADKTRQSRAAAEHYRKAATLSAKVETKVLALNLLAQSYDAQHLNEPKQMEETLRDLIRVKPDDLAPVYRLAKLQEDTGSVDAAEETLLGARRQQPDTVDPCRMLAQFYARRATALHQQTEAQKAPQAASGPGERDEHGVYRVVTPPARLGVPQLPPEARAAGIQGVVVAEIVVNESGEVMDAQVLRSIPLLDDAALNAIRYWRYAPTLVNGQPVPVKMTVTVNFSLR